MRHHNSYSNSCFRHRCGEKITEPYQSQYINSYNKTKFAAANLKNTYIKVLQYVADHDGCKRVDININVLGWKIHYNAYGKKSVQWYSRGQHSNMYSQLLYLDVIDYDKNFCYHITDKGREVLKTAYLNEMAKFIKAS